jgi:uncharacterized protein YkwD
MSVKALIGRRAAAIATVAVLALGVAACAPAPSGSAGPSDPFIASIFQAMNQDRAAAGLPALGYSPQLEGLAHNWAATMAGQGRLYHQNLSAVLGSPDYAGYHTLGENILVGPGAMSASSMESSWMASAPHRANILSGGYSLIGIGVYHGPDGRAWAVQDFGG